MGFAAVSKEDASGDGDRVLRWHPLSRNPITSGNCGCHKQLPFVGAYKRGSYFERCRVLGNSAALSSSASVFKGPVSAQNLLYQRVLKLKRVPSL